MHTFSAGFLERLDGPLHLRFFMQPLTAILFAVRDGIKDAHAGRGAYGWSLLNDPAQRRYLLEDGWKGISKVFILACALDFVYQVAVWRTLNPLGMLLVATILSVIPYALLRGPVNRLVHLLTMHRSHP